MRKWLFVFEMNLPKLNPKESLMDHSVVENFIQREGKRERGVIFLLYLFHTDSYICLFWIQFLRISSFLVQYPLFPILLPINLSLCQFDSTMTAIFNTALCEVKITLNIEFDLTTPAHPRTIRESLSQSNSRQLHHGNICRSNSVKEDEKYSKHYRYQCTENRT